MEADVALELNQRVCSKSRLFLFNDLILVGTRERNKRGFTCIFKHELTVHTRAVQAKRKPRNVIIKEVSC